MFRRILAAVIAFIILTNQMTAIVKADPVFDEWFYSSNDIIFYDNRCETGQSTAEVLSLNGITNKEKILKFLIAPAQGLTIAQAAGVIGNFMAESGNRTVEVNGQKEKDINPAAIQGGGNAPPNYTPVSGTGFGIAQWTFTARQKPLVEYMRPYGDMTSLDGQVGFMWQELNGTHAEALRMLKQTDNYMDATFVFHKYYEGSADSMAQIAGNRGGYAKAIMEAYSDAPALDTSDIDALSTGDEFATRDDSRSASGSRSCETTTDGKGLVGLVKQYAWEEYKGNTITPKDAYRDAVNRAIGERRYVGGTLYKGIDCGGFVTTLIIDSKFDPEYNNGSLLARGAGNTVAQEVWLKKNWQPISSTDATDRQPGDVAINETHTYIFVGSEAFDNQVPIASASWDERAPMQGREAVADSSFRWYRKTGTPPSTAIPVTAGGGGGSW